MRRGLMALRWPGGFSLRRDFGLWTLAMGLVFCLCVLGGVQRSVRARTAPFASTSAVPQQVLSMSQLQGRFALNVPWQFTGPDGQHFVTTPPARWEKNYQRLWPVMGKGVYRLDLKLPEQAVGQSLLFDCEMIAGNRFRLYANEQLVGYNGFYPESTSRVAQFDVFQPTSRQVALRLEVENHTLHWSGLVTPLYLGFQQDIRYERYRHDLEFNAFFGAFFFIAFFHFILFVAFRKDRTVIWFGLLYLALVVYMEFFRMHNLEYLLGDIPLEWSVRGVRLALYSLIPCFFWYGHSLSEHFISRRVAYGFSFASLGFMASLVLPGHWHTPLLYLWFLLLVMATSYGLWVLLRNYKDPAIHPFLLSLSIYAVTLVNDMFNALGWWANGFYGRYGFLVFALTQSGFLAWRLQANYRSKMRYQEELLHMNQNLEQLVSQRTQEVEEKNQQLEQMAQFKDEMVDMLVHDLKTPLNVLLTAPEPQHVQRASQRVKTLIEQLVKAQHTDAQQWVLEKEHQDIQQLVARVLQLLQPWASTRQITLANLLEPQLLVMDTPLVERVVQNVVQNALRHAPVGSEIKVVGHTQDGFFQVLIEDQGKGIPLELQQKVLEKGVSFAPDGGSTGLGLYFCKKVLEAHGGQLAFAQLPQSGVLLRFPQFQVQEATLPAFQVAHLEALISDLQALKQYEVYEISQVRQILRRLESQGDRLIQPWIDALKGAVREVNETRYRALIAQIPLPPEAQ